MALNISDLPVGLIQEVGEIGLWLQALGIVIVATIIFQVITFFLNRRRLKELKEIRQDMVRIEGKIDSIIYRNGQKNVLNARK